MDEQIARMVFDSFAGEVVKYAKKPTTSEDLAETIKSKVTHNDQVSVKQKDLSIVVDATLYLGKDKKEKVDVNITCSIKDGKIIAGGSVTPYFSSIGNRTSSSL